jgi:Glutamine amidotransferase domain
MLSRLEHRGPDDQGEVGFSGAWLGHRPVSIVDVDGGHQPLGGAPGGRWLVGNGEIHNHEKVRRSLATNHYRTQSDNEVALRLLEQRGPEALGELEGMYALLSSACSSRAGWTPRSWPPSPPATAPSADGGRRRSPSASRAAPTCSPRARRPSTCRPNTASFRDFADPDELHDELIANVNGLHNLNLQRCDRVTMAPPTTSRRSASYARPSRGGCPTTCCGARRPSSAMAAAAPGC